MRAIVGPALESLVGSKYSQASTGAKLAIGLDVEPVRRKAWPSAKEIRDSRFIQVLTSAELTELLVQIRIQGVDQLALELQLAAKLIAALPLGS